jgi:hypothetical protein
LCKNAAGGKRGGGEGGCADEITATEGIDGRVHVGKCWKITFDMANTMFAVVFFHADTIPGRPVIGIPLIPGRRARSLLPDNINPTS